VNEQTVTQVVGILYLTTGREVTDDAIDAWAVALANTPDGGDALEVAAELARSVEFVTLAAFYKALVASRRRRSLERHQRVFTLVGGDETLPLSDPRAWAEFRKGVQRMSVRLGKPVPRLPEEPPAGVSMTPVLNNMYSDDPAEAPA
jgi:hypothetical protein